VVLLCLARVCEMGHRYSGCKDVVHSRLSTGATAPAARKIIKRLSPERKLNSTEILREIIYQEENRNTCLVSARAGKRGGERERERETSPECHLSVPM